MTDPNAPTLDPVEDRVRRTFAARAEDMAPGDTDDAPPDIGRDGGASPRRFRDTRRPVLAAAVVVVVAAVTAGVALVARDRDAGRPTTVAEQPPASDTDLAAVTAPRAVVQALRDERTLAAARLIGIENAIALPVTDTAQARRRTDAAVEAFAEFVAASPHGAAYRHGLDGLAALHELRGDIDASTSPRNLENVDPTLDAVDRYAGIAGGLLDDQQAFAAAIDDPDLRDGALAYGRGLRLSDQTNQLLPITLLVLVRPDKESATDLGRLRTEVQHGLDALVAETTGTPFAGAAATVVGEVKATGLLEATERALSGTDDADDTVSVLRLLLADRGWPAFLDHVEHTLAATS